MDNAKEFNAIMAPDGLAALYEEKVDPGALPPFVGLAGLPQPYRDYLQSNLERQGKLPGVMGRIKMRRSIYTALARYGHNEDEVEEDQRKEAILRRWLRKYLSADSQLQELLDDIAVMREELDAEIENLDNQIEDLKTLPETDHHNETLERLRQDRERLAEYRDGTGEFEASGTIAAGMASKSGVQGVRSGFAAFREKVSEFLANMRAKRHSASFNTMGNPASAVAAAASAATTATTADIDKPKNEYPQDQPGNQVSQPPDEETLAGP